MNHFFAAWQRNGWEAGPLGYPTTDEIVNPDGLGRRQEFQNTAAIYWKLNEAYAVRGAIRDKWNTVNAEQPGSLLGYPVTDEVVLPDGQGRMNRFERGFLYWHPSHGAHPVTGVTLWEWSGSGYEAGYYGYPTSDQGTTTTQVTQSFQNGQINYGLINPVSQQYGDCALNTEWPHVSTHQPGTVNVETKGSCTGPKKKIEVTTMLIGPVTCYVVGDCNAPANQTTGSVGDGSTAEVQEELKIETDLPCTPGEYFAYSKWKITDANDQVTNVGPIFTKQIKLGYGTGGIDKKCDGTYA